MAGLIGDMEAPESGLCRSRRAASASCQGVPMLKRLSIILSLLLASLLPAPVVHSGDGSAPRLGFPASPDAGEEGQLR